MFQNVIVRKPCKQISEGITTNPELGKPDYEKALKQHGAYVDALKSCGVSVTELPADEAYPDSCFVEDTAVLTKKCAIITNPGAASRNGETRAMEPVIRQFYADSCMEFIEAPGTLEGGDVMMVGDHFYVGRSARTNAEGIRQFLKILGKYGLTGEEVLLDRVLHLKTGVNYLENGNMLAAGEFLTKPEFQKYHLCPIPDGEAYAANCIRVNETVLIPAGYPRTEAAVKAMGYAVILVDTSEFRKIDGGLSCLSLRF